MSDPKTTGCDWSVRTHHSMRGRVSADVWLLSTTFASVTSGPWCLSGSYTAYSAGGRVYLCRGVVGEQLSITGRILHSETRWMKQALWKNLQLRLCCCSFNTTTTSAARTCSTAFKQQEIRRCDFRATDADVNFISDSFYLAVISTGSLRSAFIKSLNMSCFVWLWGCSIYECILSVPKVFACCTPWTHIYWWFLNVNWIRSKKAFLCSAKNA